MGHSQADDLVHSLHWLLLCIRDHLGPWGLPAQAVAGGPPGRVNEITNKLGSAGWSPLHIFAFPCSSKELPSGENSPRSPITVLPSWFWNASVDLFIANRLTFLVTNSLFFFYKLKNSLKCLTLKEDILTRLFIS